MCTAGDRSFGSIAEALRAANATMDYLNSPAAEPESAGCGETLIALGEIRAKLTAAHARFLARFDAADAHDADGYGTSVTWLIAMARMTKNDARAAMQQMRTLRAHRPLGEALAAGEITASWAEQILAWVKKLPRQLREDTETILAIEKILIQAAASGASLDDLAAIVARAVAAWQADHPDPDEDDGFDDRYVQAGSTFRGAGVLRGTLTGECAAAVQAVLEALGKRAGPEDARSPGQRFHDALQLGCELLIRARMVPGRAGADTLAMVHMALTQLRQDPRASAIEETWLAGTAAEAAACDALTVPVVTGRADMTVIDTIINLVLSAGHHHDAATRAMTPDAWQALRYAIARLAIDFVSGPDGIAAALRAGLLAPPYNTPSLPLDIGQPTAIPAQIRRAVLLRDKHCAWPRCDRPAAWCDVHHLRHKAHGGKTAVTECVLLCQYRHDICIHRDGWRLTLHPDGTTTAHGPHGQTLHGHSPPTTRAG